jgi:hypothetical protein
MNTVYGGISSGELVGVTSATQLPDVPCREVLFRVTAGTVYLGGAGVTVSDGSTDTTSGLKLTAADPPVRVRIDNLNKLYRICASVNDHLTYLVVR